MGKYPRLNDLRLTVVTLIALGNPGILSSSPKAAIHPAPGTSIVHFAELDNGVYKGSKPKSDADFRFLRSRHIKYILNVNFLPYLSGSEKRKAAKYGIAFMTGPMNASVLPPQEKHVDRILLILRDPCFHPIYFHCELGRDRTSLIAALYDIYFRGASVDQGWREMNEDGFKDWWPVRGLKAYFKKHPQRPASLVFTPHPCN